MFRTPSNSGGSRRISLLTFTILAMILLLSGNTFALQSSESTAIGNVSGQVVTIGGDPLGLTTIRVVGTRVGTLTRADGSFLLEGVPTGTHSFEISHLGFVQQMTPPLEVVKGETLQLGVIELKPSVHFLQTATYTVSRSRQQLQPSPMPSSSIDAVSFRLMQPASSAEILREQPGIQIQKTSHGGGHAIMRGMTSNRVLLLVDGIRLNNSTYRLGNHPYLTFIDPLGLERMDVVRGPGSVLHGSDALGGTINMITETAPFSKGGVVASSSLLGRYASADEEQTGHGTLALSARKWSFTLAGGYSSFGDLRSGEEGDPVMSPAELVDQSPTGFDVSHMIANLKLRLTDGMQLQLGHQRTDRPEVPRYDKYVNGGDYRWLYTPQRRELSFARFSTQTPLSWLQRVETTLSLHHQAEGRSSQGAPDEDRTDEFDEVYTTGLSVVGEWQKGRHQGVIGFDSYRDQVQSKRTFYLADGTVELDQRGRFPDDAHYLSLGLFAQDQIALTQHVSMLLGVRGSRYSTQLDTPASGLPFSDVDLDFQAVTGSVGFLAAVTRSITLTSSLSQGFRAPNLGDMAKLGESKGSTFEVPNADLDPEQVLTFDAGIAFHTPRVELELNGYITSIDQIISSMPATYNGSEQIVVGGQAFDVRRKENVGEGFIRGVEWRSVVLLMDQLQFRSSLTYTYGQNTTLDEPFDGIPPMIGYAGLRYVTPSVAYSIEPYIRFAGKQDRLSSDDKDDDRIPEGGTPGWMTVNLRGSTPVIHGFSLTLGLENMLDLRYRVHASGINAPGRQVLLSLNYQPPVVRFK